MKTTPLRLPVLFCGAALVVGCTTESAQCNDLYSVTNRAFEIQTEADWVVDYGWDHKLDIGIGVSRDGLWYAKTFELHELDSFWAKQKNKGLIVVNLDKFASDAECAALGRMFTDYFLKVGFNRVCIQQAGGRGVWILSDETAP